MWNAVEWTKTFRAASAARDGDSLHGLRRQVWSHTVEIVRASVYEVGRARVDLDAASAEALRQRTVLYPHTNDLVVAPAQRGQYRTLVSVHNADFLEIARAIATPECVPAVLNMANRRNPGGGVHDGAGAQEENLFRRSNAFCSLYQFVDYASDYSVPRNEGASYPIPRESGAIYSPGVTVFRSAETTGYALLGHPYRVNVLTVPAINEPALIERQRQLWLTDQMARATLLKIRAMFRVAARHEQPDVVLSAFGCGAFRNPPQHMAELFREVLAEREFAGVFRRVAFAIIDDHNAFHRASPEGNCVPFERAGPYARLKQRCTDWSAIAAVC
ncbi:MAG: TIGR02452 family protein [Dehalococcoidia bacterium]